MKSGGVKRFVGQSGGGAWHENDGATQGLDFHEKVLLRAWP
jgi:hypothetical protein